MDGPGDTGGTSVKAISLWQPWATAMAIGLKKNETRSWPTHHRGDLLICSTKREPSFWEMQIVWRANKGYIDFPLGRALCIVEVYDCVPTSGSAPNGAEGLLGDYSHGRFIWLTRNLRRLPAPIPVIGRQGFFDVDVPMEVIK